MAVGILLLAAAVPADAEDLSGLLERSGWTRSQQQAVRAVFDRARQEQVPPELLLPRLQEGLAKRVPAVRVVRALETELGTLRRARALLQGIDGGGRLLQDRASWSRTANLLASGLAEEEVGDLVRACRPRGSAYRPATLLYLSLRRWGLGQEEVLALIAALAASAVPGESFAGIQDILIEARSLRQRPEETVERLVELLPGAASVQELKEKVLYRSND